MLARPALFFHCSILKRQKPFISFTPQTLAYSTKMASKNISSSTAKANDFLSFVDASPTPYHAVSSAISLLKSAGFTEIKERDSWASTLIPGGKYYLTRNASSLIAFAIGGKWRPGNPVAMVGAHTDSCCLRIKPVSKKTNSGFLQVGVEAYGGGIWHTWFDRDLSIAGRVMVRDGKGGIAQRLVKVDRPLLRIPTLAIHLDRKTSFEPNKENELFPIIGLVEAELNRSAGGAAKDEGGEEKEEGGEFQPLKTLSERHHPYVVSIIAEHAGVEVEDVLDFEIVLYDTQKAAIGGLNNELLFSPRLDNLGMTYTSVAGLIASVSSENTSTLATDPTIRLVSCFDHEEIGSTSAQGAASNFLPAILRRLSTLPSQDPSSTSENSYEKVGREQELDSATAYEQTLATSFLISADMAHSVHPNYVGKYESDHKPEMNKGTVIKINANQRYATNSPGIVLLQEVARRAKPSPDFSSSSNSKSANAKDGTGVPLQLFVVRNDSSCGSTIGPMLSAALGTRTIDVGNAQLSMHSIRETGGVYDVEFAIRLFESFFEHFGELEGKIFVD